MQWKELGVGVIPLVSRSPWALCDAPVRPCSGGADRVTVHVALE